MTTNITTAGTEKQAAALNSVRAALALTTMKVVVGDADVTVHAEPAVRS